MSEWNAKRFWKAASVVEQGGGWTVTLDGRAVKTPAKAALILPTHTMADAIAVEWDAQDGDIKPHTMPVTRSANAAIDKVATQRDEVVAMLAEYGDTDLICYRADSPVELVARQANAWNPLVEWSAATLSAPLTVTTGVVHISQNDTSRATLFQHVDRLGAFELAAFHDLVSMSGSLIIGLAVIRGLAPPEDLWEISRIDELWQEEQWGADEEATATAAIKRDSFLHAARFFLLSQKLN